MNKSRKLMESVTFGTNPAKVAGGSIRKGFRQHENRAVLIISKPGRSFNHLHKLGESLIDAETTEFKDGDTVDVESEIANIAGPVASNTSGIGGRNATNTSPSTGSDLGPGADQTIPVGNPLDGSLEGNGATESPDATVADEAFSAFFGKKSSKVTESAPSKKPAKSGRRKYEANLTVSINGFTGNSYLRSLAGSLGVEGDSDFATGTFVFKDLSPEQLEKIRTTIFGDTRVVVTEDLDTPEWDNPELENSTGNPENEAGDPENEAGNDTGFLDNEAGAPVNAPGAPINDAGTPAPAPAEAPIAPVAPPSATQAASVAAVTGKALDLLNDLAKAQILTQSIAATENLQANAGTIEADKDPELKGAVDPRNDEPARQIGESKSSRLNKLFRKF